MAGLKLTVSLGLLSVAARSEAAIDKPETPKNLCLGQPGKKAHDPAPQQAPATCGVCGPITDFGSIVKGFPTGDGYAIVKQEDVAEAKETYANEYKKKLSLVGHPAQQFLADTGPGDTLNYLTPEAGHEDQYQLLRAYIEAHPELCFVSLHTPRTATSLYMVRVKDGVLLMEKRTRSQQLKATPLIGGEVNEMYLAQLNSMTDMFVTDYDPAAYEDRYRAALDDIIAEAEQITVEGATKAGTTPPVAKANTADLMEKMAALHALQGGKADKPKKKAPAKKKSTTKAA